MKEDFTKVTLVGGPTVIVEFCGLRFLTDPTFDAGGNVYNLGEVTLQKKSSPSILPPALGHIDAILLSHDQHMDNLDLSGREYLKKVKTVFTTPDGAKRLGDNAQGIQMWETTSLDSPNGKKVNITATPSRHGPAGIEAITGEVTGFMIESQDGNNGSIYITGDTVYFEGVAEVARRFSPQLIIAFAGAARTRGPFNLTMSVNDLLDTAHAFPYSLIIPAHTEGWEHFTESTKDIEIAFSALSKSDRIKLISPGDTCSLQSHNNRLQNQE